MFVSIQDILKCCIYLKMLLDSPFIFSFRVKLPCIFLSSASMVSPPMSASRCVRFTMPTPNTISVTCWGSELTKLRLRPSRLGGVSPSDSNTNRHGGSAGLRPPSEEQVNRQIGPKAVNIRLVLYHSKAKIRFFWNLTFSWQLSVSFLQDSLSQHNKIEFHYHNV